MCDVSYCSPQRLIVLLDRHLCRLENDLQPWGPHPFKEDGRHNNFHMQPRVGCEELEAIHWPGTIGVPQKPGIPL